LAEPRLFTVAEAERTLPLVRRIVQDIMGVFPVWRAAVSRYELLAANSRADEGETQALITSREVVAREAERISAFLTELEQIGCVFKGFEAGVVDFYSLYEDRLVFLCWKPGEEHIGYWHEVDSGYAGRQPLEAGMLTEAQP
jgi:hypothetical protein